MEAQSSTQHHDAAVPHGIHIFIGDVVGQGDRCLARIRLGLAADVELAALQINPVGLQLRIEIVREAELAMNRQTAQGRGIDVEDNVLVPTDRHRAACARHLPVGPGRGIGPARPLGQRRACVCGHVHMGVRFLGAGFGPCAEQKGHRKQQSWKQQAKWHVHDGDPLSRDRESRFLYLGMKLQRIGRFAKLLSGGGCRG